MQVKKKNRLIVILCAAVLLAAAVVVILILNRGEDDPGGTALVRTGEEAGVSVEWGLSASDFADNSAVTAWLEKCSRPDRDDQDAYALRYADTAPDGTVSCTWLVFRRDGDSPAGQPSVAVSETRDGEVTVILTYADDGGVMTGNLCRVSGSFDREPGLEIEGVLGLIVSVTNQPF